MMLPAAFLLLVQGYEDSIPEWLRYLARHQGPDGSWGKVVERCSCPHDPPAKVEDAKLDPGTREKIAALVEQLGDDDPAVRAKAHADLVAAGEAAVPALAEASKSNDAERRARARDALRQISAGRSMTDLELTSLITLVFLGAGYSHLSKDTYDQICYGDVVRNAIRWLMSRQREDGSFEDGNAATNALAALALSEAYGLTGSNLFKDRAARAVEHVVSLQPSDTPALFWQGMVLKSAEVCDLGGPRAERLRKIREELLKREDAYSRAAAALFACWSGLERDGGGVDRARSLDVSRPEPGEIYAATLAIFVSDGPTSEPWKQWSPQLKTWLISLTVQDKDRCDRGSWSCETLRERLWRSGHLSLLYESYYRYANLVGNRR